MLSFATIVEQRAVNFGKQGIFFAKSAAFALGVHTHFVVSDKDRFSLLAAKSSHPIGRARYEQSVAHAVALARNYVISKALGQIQNSLGIGHERAVSNHRC